MDLALLIKALTDSAAYPYPVEKVEVRHTHISVVFLAGPFAYKIKKPVNLGFLDFDSLEKRRHFCEEEIRLNRRLAPEVYIGVVPVTRTERGVQWEGTGEAIEWAVKMQRLPEEATLEKRLQRGEVGIDRIRSLARTVASFHAHAAGGRTIAAFGRFDIVARNVRENFTHAVAMIGQTLSRSVFERLRELTEETLNRLRPIIESRAERGAPRDTHGDLHLDHVYMFPERTPPADLVIIDCIEFNERFRYADPVSDMAFLVMDLHFHGRRDLATAFVQEYFQASGDEEGRALLPLYVAYRAAVRGKVEGIELFEKEIPEAERSAALPRAQAHWLLAYRALELPDRTPCLVLIGGLPGTGKSTLAQGLSERANFRLIRSDLVRKELAGIPAHQSARSRYGEGIYSSAWTERTYAECAHQAQKLLFEGHRVIVDAGFGQEKQRQSFLELAARLCVPVLFLQSQAGPEEVRRRLERRQGDASDADWSIYQKASERWEEIGPVPRLVLREVSTIDGKDQALAQALAAVSAASLPL